MRFFLRLMGVEVASVGAEINRDARNRPVWIDGTGGNFELAEEDYSGEYEEECPGETYGFGFGGE